MTLEEILGLPIEVSPLLIVHRPQTGANRVRLRFWPMPGASRAPATTSCNHTMADAKDQSANLIVVGVRPTPSAPSRGRNQPGPELPSNDKLSGSGGWPSQCLCSNPEVQSGVAPKRGLSGVFLRLARPSVRRGRTSNLPSVKTKSTVIGHANDRPQASQLVQLLTIERLLLSLVVY